MKQNTECKSAQSVLSFWFETLDSKDWYRKSDELDALIKDRFESTVEAIVAGETESWRDSPEGRLAEVIALDQFSRNMYRGTAKAFSQDSLALALAQESVRNGDALKLSDTQRSFLYMPYMHSESLKVHDIALRLFEGTGNFEYEVKHRKIIEQFGRYPHRNELLGRESTAEELEWMKHNSGF